MFTPYAIDKVKDPVRLPSRNGPGQRNDRANADVQMCMFQEAFGRVGESVEEDIYCLVNLIVELAGG